MKAKETARIIRAIAQSLESDPKQLSIRVNVLDSRIISSGPELDVSTRSEAEVEGLDAAVDRRIATTVAALRALADAARAKDRTRCDELYGGLDDLGFMPPVVVAVTGACLQAAGLLPGSA